jgi:peptide deformylase
MAIRRILQLGDPLLRTTSRPVSHHEAAPILADLRDTLHEFQRTHGFGRGISAIQIGEAVRVIYIEIDDQSFSLVNPEFTLLSEEKFKMWDDCFSFPHLMVWLERHSRVGVRYTGADGKENNLMAEGAFAELLQHELDHLDGVLSIDRSIDRDSFCTRDEWQRRYRFNSAPL